MLRASEKRLTSCFFVVKCEKPGGWNRTGFSNQSDIRSVVMAKFIVVNGIRIASEFEAATHGRLAVIGPAFRIGRHSKQVFECECGNVIVALVSNVISGNTTSCGCYRKKANTKHGNCNHHLYQTWSNMLERCCNPSAHNYHRYGGRGITVCDRWRDNFANFISDMGERPDGCTLDRIDNSKGYEPGNCKWATWVEQNNNTRRNRLLSHNGKTQTMTQWAREFGFEVHTIRDRLRLGWSVERALSEPVQVEYKRKAKQ